jgi:hypothetical protein
MQAFTDTFGREWLVRLTVGNIADVYDRLGLSIYMLVENDQADLAELIDDLPLLANVVYLLCRTEARALQVDPAGFCRGIGEVESMQDAFLRALVRFFPDPDPKRKEKAGSGTEKRDHDWWERNIMEAAGVAGLDPLGHSLRTIQSVAMGRQAEAWGHTSNIMAQVANIHRDKKKRGTPFTPQEFNPILMAAAKPKDGTSLIASVATGMLAPDKAAKFALIIAAKQHAKETGDWSEFKRLTS